MCNFFSAIILKSGPALFAWDSDSHETIKEENKLKDNKLPPDFVPVELTPPAGNYGETDLSKWIFKTDLDSIPDWYDPEKARKKTEEALAVFIRERFLINQELDEVKDKNLKVIENCKIKKLVNCNVGEMWGSSNVGEMWGSSNVGEMWGSSKVGVMRESSNVGEMRESSNVGEMRESSKVGEMRESSKVDKLADGATCHKLEYDKWVVYTPAKTVNVTSC